MSNNPVLNSNPFGATSEQDVSAFELQVGHRLPEAYRSYLLQHNGAEFERSTIGEQGLGVHNLYGLHDGPDYANLKKKWRVSDYYDLEFLSDLLQGHLVFGNCGTGELLVLNLGSGAVEVLDQEVVVDGFSYTQVSQFTTHLAPGFDTFVEGLISFDASLDLLPEDERLDFQRRLAEFERQAREEYGQD